MATYTTISDYIVCSTDDQERLARIKESITLLETVAIQSIGNMDLEEYEMNDGQVKIKTAYRSVKEIADAILSFQRIYDLVFNRCSGTRVVSLRDARSFNLNSGNGY